MPVDFDSTSLGVPVEVSLIAKELKKLWESASGSMTRASLINFAVFFRGTAGFPGNIALMNDFTRQHACRALLLCHEPSSPEEKVSAWINAHCHLSKAGAKQVCCEQVALLFEGRTAGRIPSTLFANLDSDLPLYLWWQGEFPDPIDETLWSRVDRLIFDSQTWEHPREQFQRLRDSLERAQTGIILCDLNWARTLHLRQALAQMFDHPENLSVLQQLRTVKIAHALENRSTALLLVSWLGAQLKLSGETRQGGGFLFEHPGGHRVAFELQAEPGRSISLCELSDGASTVRVHRDQQGDFFRVEVRLRDGAVYHHLLPAGSNSTTSLLLWEIGGGSRHKIYHRALSIIDRLL
jgi:glucose-6-phosphate dehydrogenase assembly protein OpcA